MAYLSPVAEGFATAGCCPPQDRAMLPPMRLALAALIALSLATEPALAQSGGLNIYGPDGRYAGRMVPDNHGGVQFYDSQGHYVGRAQGSIGQAERLFGSDGAYSGRISRGGERGAANGGGGGLVAP